MATPRPEELIASLAAQTKGWRRLTSVGIGDAGRAQGRFRSYGALLEDLEQRFRRAVPKDADYAGRPCTRGAPGTQARSSAVEATAAAAARCFFSWRPSLRPCSLPGRGHAGHGGHGGCLHRPLCVAPEPRGASSPSTRVPSVTQSAEETFNILRLLDESDRLRLIPASESESSYHSVLGGLKKDAEKYRPIFIRMPEKPKEHSPTFFCRRMGAANAPGGSGVARG